MRNHISKSILLLTIIILIVLVEGLNSNTISAKQAKPPKILSIKYYVNGKPCKTNIISLGKLGIIAKLKAYGHRTIGKYKYDIKYVIHISDYKGLTVWYYSRRKTLESGQEALLLTLNISLELNPWLTPPGVYILNITVFDLISNMASYNMSYFFVRDSPITLEYDLNMTLTLENPWVANSEIELLLLAIPLNISRIQRLISFKVLSNLNYTLFKDEVGNQYLVFRNINVKPISRFTIKVNFKLEYNILAIKLPKLDVDVYERLKPRYEEFLKSTPEITWNVKPIINTAKHILAGRRNIYNVLFKICNFVSTWIHYDINVPEDKDVLWIYTNRRGMCTHYSKLFIALARAIGIPSRMISGLNLGVSKINTRYRIEDVKGHDWVEVYVPKTGWIQIEPQNPFYIGRVIPGHIAFIRCRRSYVVKFEDKKFNPAIYILWFRKASPRVKLSVEYIVKAKYPKDIPLKVNVNKTRIHLYQPLPIQIALNESTMALIYLVFESAYGVRIVKELTTHGSRMIQVIFSPTGIGIWRIYAVAYAEGYNPTMSNTVTIEVYSNITVTISCDKNITYVGEPVNIFIRLTPKINGSVTVMLGIGNTTVRKFNVNIINGLGKCSVLFKSPGVWNVKAIYGGGKFYTNSTSNTITIRVLEKPKAFSYNVILAIISVGLILALIIIVSGRSKLY